MGNRIHKTKNRDDINWPLKMDYGYINTWPYFVLNNQIPFSLLNFLKKQQQQKIKQNKENKEDTLMHLCTLGFCGFHTYLILFDAEDSPAEKQGVNSYPIGQMGNLRARNFK